MPEVIGYEKTFYPHAVVKESNFPKRVMKIGNRNIEGREIYDFFVTEEEFQKVKEKYCRDGWYDVPLYLYKRNEPINIGVGNPSRSPSKEFLERVRRGEFIISSDINIRKTLKKLSVFPRQIKWYHKLGWPFKT